MTTLAQARHLTQLSLRRLAPALGAIVSGVDLSENLDVETIAAIRSALDDNLVLFFERQTWTPEQQRDSPGASATCTFIRCIRVKPGCRKL